jgi:hypothetical protein
MICGGGEQSQRSVIAQVHAPFPTVDDTTFISVS